MAKRAKKTATKKQAPKKRALRKNNRAKKVKSKKGKETAVTNKKAHWDAFKELQKRVDKAWAKLKGDVKKKVKPEILLRDKNHLLLLLGECNYMARECMRFTAKKKKQLC